MNQAEFIRLYNESRNGANHMVRHPLARNVIYSDGMQEVCEVGTYWLLDILATGLPGVMRDNAEHMLVIEVAVKDSKARISATGSGDKVMAWSRTIDWTDMPEGAWTFYMSAGGGEFSIILPSEY